MTNVAVIAKMQNEMHGKMNVSMHRRSEMPRRVQMLHVLLESGVDREMKQQFVFHVVFSSPSHENTK